MPFLMHETRFDYVPSGRLQKEGMTNIGQRSTCGPALIWPSDSGVSKGGGVANAWNSRHMHMHTLAHCKKLMLMTLGWVGMPGAIWMCFLLQLRLAHSTRDSQCCGYMHVPEGMTLLGCWHYQ